MNSIPVQIDKSNRVSHTNLTHHLHLLAYIFSKWVTVCSKSFTYLQNLGFCSLSRVKYHKYIFHDLTGHIIKVEGIY